jgi:hypothetical protein
MVQTAGFGGFNMIVDTECMGRANDQWISMLMESYETALKAAEEEDLVVWLFDDWGYPSGTAGGLVCTEDSLRLKKLVISHDCMPGRGEQLSLTVPDNIVTAGMISNGAFYRLKLKRGEVFSYTAKAGNERLVIVSWEFDEQKAKSLCKSYPGDPAMSLIDMLNPKAAEKFLEVLHERYYSRFSNYFGTVIKGFFYDEPYLSFGFPWTERLPAEFQRKKGYDLLDVLPVMMINVQNCDSKELRTYMDDYFDVWTAMAAENFYGVLARWCKSHGVELSGHADLDHHLNTLSTVSGHFYRNMNYNTRPAVDVIWAQIEPGMFTDFPRYAGSAKRLMGRGHAVSETFAGMGQGLYGDLMRYITDHQAIRGIDDFHLMISTNDPAVNGSESPQMPNHMLQEPYGTIDKNKAIELGCEVLPGDAWIDQDVDILIPAALENQITRENVNRISKNVKIIVEAANGPTTPDADKVINDRGIFLVPDFLANAGGVTCSYFEQVQSNMNYYWDKDEVLHKLDSKMTSAFNSVYELSVSKGYKMRDAAYVIAINRVAQAAKSRGWV